MVIAEPGRSGGTRYRLLETLWQYGEAANDGHPDAVALRDRHLAHYVAIVESIRAQQQSPHEAVAMARLVDEWDNIRVALDWATTTHDGDATDTILFDLALPALYMLRWEFAEWATRLVDDWPERDPERSPMLGGAINWDLIRGDYPSVVSRIERFGPLRADRSRREEAVWHFAQATLAIATLDRRPGRPDRTVDRDTDRRRSTRQRRLRHMGHPPRVRGTRIQRERYLAAEIAGPSAGHTAPVPVVARAVAHMVVDGGETSWPAVIGDRTGDPAGHDPIGRARHASELARSVGAVIIDREIANFLMGAMLDRGSLPMPRGFDPRSMP